MEDSDWINDVALEQDLPDYIRRNLKRKEIPDFMKRDYEQYRWSITTLDRRLHFFDINYIHNDTSLETVQAAVQKELNGPGKLLGHIALNQELRMHHVQILSKRCYKTKTLKA